ARRWRDGLTAWGGGTRTCRRRFAEQPIKFRRKDPQRTRFHPNSADISVRSPKQRLQVRVLSAQPGCRLIPPSRGLPVLAADEIPARLDCLAVEGRLNA